MGNQSSRQRRPTEEKSVSGLLPVVDLVYQDYGIDNLVFASGPAEAFTYAGALRVLEKVGILQMVKRFAGVGTGGLVASLLALGMDSNDIQEAFNKHLDNMLIDDHIGYEDFPESFAETYGWNSGTKFFIWFSLLLESLSFDPDVSFIQLHEKTGKELCLVVTNVDKQTMDYCHPKLTPDLPIKRAVFMTMSVPGIFSPIRYGAGIWKCLYTDGSMMCSYPIKLFDNWLLSMDSENSLLNQLESPDHYQLCDKLDNVKNTRTLGFFRIGKTKEHLYEAFVTRLINGGADLRIPDTQLAVAYKAASQSRRATTEKFNLLRRTSVTLLALANGLQDDQGTVEVDSFAQKIFADKSLRKSSVLFPEFGENKATVKDYLLKISDGNPKLTMACLKNVFHRRLLSLLEEYSSYTKSNITNLSTYFATIFEAVHYSTMNLSACDYDRSVGILCGHIGNHDVYLEEDDQKYLYRQGWNATVAYLRLKI